MFKVLLFAITGFIFSFSAMATPVWFAPSTLFEDNAITYHLDNDSDGVFSVGDSILGVLEIDTTQSAMPGGSSVAVPPELTGVFDAYITSVTAPNAFGRVDMVFGTNPGGFFSGATDPGLAAEVAQAQGGGSGLLGGEVVRFFDGGVDDLDLASVNCLTTATCLDAASNGDFYFSFGDNGDPNFNFTLENGVLDPAFLATIAQATATGGANFNMGLIENLSGENIIDVDCLSSFCTPGDDNQIALRGSGNFFGGLGLPGEALNRGDFQFILDTAEINEPKSLALLGAGLLGLGFTSIRKKK